jgi:hypothetical protein
MSMDELALELATQVADGKSIDWVEIERHEESRRLPLPPFQALEAIVHAYRTFFPTLAHSQRAHQERLGEASS